MRQVTDQGSPVGNLNELEAINGEIWANVWLTSCVARIDPQSGVVKCGEAGNNVICKWLCQAAHTEDLACTCKYIMPLLIHACIIRMLTYDNLRMPCLQTASLLVLGVWVASVCCGASWKAAIAGPQVVRACRSWVVMDGLRSSLMAENVGGSNHMDVLNGACACRSLLHCLRSVPVCRHLCVEHVVGMSGG